MSVRSGQELQQLVRACLDGDQTAWRELVDLVTPIILGTCRSMRLSQEESLDVYGQVCLLLLKNLGRIKTPEKLLSYAATVTRREVLGLVRRSKLFDAYRQEEPTGPLGTLRGDPEADVELAQDMELLVRAVRRLPRRESELMSMLFLDETEPSYEQISRKLGIPVASIGPTRARALEKLRTILKRMGYRIDVL